MEETFQFIGLFFESSLEELQIRNSGIETSFKRISAEQFSAVVYRNGKSEARCRIRFGGRRGATSGITFSLSDDPHSNSFNESLTVEVGEQEMFLRGLGMAQWSGAKTDHLSQEGAAEFFWALFIGPLQR